MADTNDTASAFDALINQVQGTTPAEKPKEKEKTPSEPPHADDISSEFDKLITNVQAPVATGAENTPTVGQTLGSIPFKELTSGHMDVAKSIKDPEGIRDLKRNAPHIPLTTEQINTNFESEHPKDETAHPSGRISMMGYGALPALGGLSALNPPAPEQPPPTTPGAHPSEGIIPATYHALQVPGKVIADFIKPAAKGLYTAAKDTGTYLSYPYPADKYSTMLDPNYKESPELIANREAARQKVGKDVQDIVSAVPEAEREVVDAAAKPFVGGTDIWDKFLYDRGLRSYDEWKHNYTLRNDFDHIGAVQEAVHPNEWALWFNNAPEWMVDKPISTLVKATLPSPSTVQKMNPGMTFQQAQQQVNSQAMQIAREAHQQMVEDADQLGPTDKNLQLLGGFLPFGNIFHWGGEAVGAGRAGISGLRDWQKYRGLTASEIRAAKTAEGLDRAAADVARRSNMSGWGQAATHLADFLDKSETWVKGKLANIPAPIRPIAEKVLPPLAGITATGTVGGAVGALENPEDRYKGALKGIATAEAIRYAPRVLSDIAKGGMTAAGGRMGRFETAAKSPESSLATKIALHALPPFTPKFYDWIGNNLIKGIGNMAVETIPLTLALGAVRSESPEDQANLLAQGLFFSGGHKAITYALGRNASAIARQRAQDHADIVKQQQKMDPVDRENAKNLGAWDPVLKQSEEAVVNAQAEYNQAVSENGVGSAAEQIAKRNLDEAKIKHDLNDKASPETRKEYYRLMQMGLVEGDRLINGPMRSGQNLRIALRTADQLKQMILQNNPQVSPEGIQKMNPMLTPEQATTISNNKLNEYVQQYGSRWKRKGGTEATLGKFTADDGNEIVLDPSKQTVVVNMDNVYGLAKMGGKPFYHTFFHELGHAMQDIPEFREANKEAYNTLFGNEVKDENGNVIGGKPGALSTKNLVEMFAKEYLGKRGGYNQADIVRFAQANGMWDKSREALDENAVAEYMKHEVLADLNSNALHLGLDRALGMKQGMADWARLQSKNENVKRAVANVLGLGQEHPFTGAATGYEFSPEVLAANRKAIRALASLNGEVSPSISAPETPMVTKAGILADKGLLERYGKDSGLVKTQMRGVITDAEGKVIKTVDISNPMAAEGTWQTNPDGSARQTSGYGQLPDELVGTDVPPGGAIRVENQVVMQPDGVTPVLNSKKETKELLTQRAQLIRDALDNTDDVGTPGRFRAVSADGLTYRGTFTPLQIKALQNLPETIVPRSLKETILKLNELVARRDGSRIFADYAARMDAKGNYRSFSPKIYDLVPIGMHFSKDGNFLATTISVGRIFDKLNLWSQRMPGRLAYWGGDRDAFFNEFITKYLKNWQEKKPGETDLDPDPEKAIAKRDIFNDFLNLSVADANPDVTIMPKAPGSRRRSKADQDLDRTIMSVRADAITGLVEHAAGTKVPVDYYKAKHNLMPNALEPGNRLGYEEELPEYAKNHTYDEKLTPIHGFTPIGATQTGAEVLQSDRLLSGVVDQLRRTRAESERAASEAGKGTSGYGFQNYELRTAEEKALAQYAKDNGLLLDYSDFTNRWIQVPPGKTPVKGAEHEVILSEPEVEKRSPANLNRSFGEYFDRLIGHAIAFPETAPRFVGVQTPSRGYTYIVTKQPYVPNTGEDVTVPELVAHMKERGFYPVGSVPGFSGEITSFYNPETGMHVDDLHTGNAIKTIGVDGKPRVAVIDPQIRSTRDDRWDLDTRQTVFQQNPELRARMQNPELLPEPRVNRGNVRKMPVMGGGIDIAGLEEVGPNYMPLSKEDREKALRYIVSNKLPPETILKGLRTMDNADVMALTEKLPNKLLADMAREVSGKIGGSRVNNITIVRREVNRMKGPGANFMPAVGESKPVPTQEELNRMPSSKLDETYAKAIESGDMEEAQRLVDEAAKKAGYAIGPVWHGTSGDFYEFQPSGDEKAIFLSTNKNEAKAFASGKNGKVMGPLYVKATGPDKLYHATEEREAIREARKNGYTGIKVTDQLPYSRLTMKPQEQVVNYAVFSPEQIKSADPITYDDQGKLIPLSQRFDTTNGDIRFMPRGSEGPSKDLPDAIERAKAALKPGNMPKRVTASTPKKFTTLEVAPDPKDKATDELVTGGDEAISVGNTVFFKNPVYGDTAGAAFMAAKKVENFEPVEGIDGYGKAKTKGGKWAVYGPKNILATGKQFETDKEADKAAKAVAAANEPLSGIPYSLQEGRTGKWKILDKSGEQAASKTFSNPAEAADYAIALHRERLPLSAVKKFLPKADRDAVTEAEQRIADIQAKNPESMPLIVARDEDTGLPKIDLLEDAEGNPILDEKGKQKRGVIFRQLPYQLRQSPKLDAQNDTVAVQQAADLMTPEVKAAMADPSVAKAIGWYQKMREKLQRDFGANIELFGQLLGATSARTPVDENFKQTLEAARQYSKGAYDELLQRFHNHIIKATEDLASGELQKRWEAKNPTKSWNDREAQDALRMEINRFDEVPVRSNGKKFNANSQKVLHALYGNWLEQTVGPKTPNFAGNLTGRTLRATIDVWAARNLRRLLYDDGKSQWRLLPEQEKGVDSAINVKGQVTGDFPFAQNVYDEVANRVGMNADDLQALMWFYEKGIWDKNGWTGSAGAKKSSFEEEAGKMALDRYQAGVTAWTHSGDYPDEAAFREGVQEETRKAIRNQIGKLPGVEISRVTHSDGLYGGSVEPSLDVEFSVSRDETGKPQSIAPVIDELKRIGKENNQYDTFISQVVEGDHSNARPMVEVGFKSPAKPEEIDAVVQSFRDAGIDGFTLAKDSKGKVIGIRAQYIPEISARWDGEGRGNYLDPQQHGQLSQDWAKKARQAVNSLGTQQNISYTNEGHVSTHVYGKEEYDTHQSPQDLLGSNVGDQLGRRKQILETPAGEGQVSSGNSPDSGGS